MKSTVSKATLSKAIVSASARITPQFYDLDPMDIVWHGNYARYFELARCAVMELIGYGYREMRESGFAWPIVDMHVRYFHPLTLGDTAEVTASIVEWEHRLKTLYVIRDAATGKRLTSGHTTQVAVNTATRELQWETPAALRDKLCPYLR